MKLNCFQNWGDRARLRGLIGAGLLWLGVGCAAARGGDWPQVLGPQRNGQAQGEEIVLPWPSDGPQVQWTKSVGAGFAGVAIQKGMAILFHRNGAELVAEALDVESGKSRWRTTFPTSYVSTISSDDGPRCVPLIHQQSVFLLGPGGELACVELETGRKVWSRNICREFKAPEGYFGTGSSPIIDSEKLLVNVGGRGGAGLVAFSPLDGKTLWQSTDEAASYSSPVAATIAGQRHVIFVTRLEVVSVDPSNGAVRFQFPFGARGPTVNAANPLVIGDHVFVSASYGVGAQWAKIGPREATKVWANDDVMSSQYTTCVEKDGVLYGIDGRQDVGMARLRAFDPRSGKIHWTQEGFGTGSLILAGDKLLILRTDGALIAAEATAAAYRPLAEARLFDTTAQALPALANGLVLARDTRTLKCAVVGRRK